MGKIASYPVHLQEGSNTTWTLSVCIACVIDSRQEGESEHRSLGRH